MIKQLLMLLACGLSLLACSATRSAAPPANTIRLKGSDTMVPLAQRWAEEFMQRHTGVAVYAEGGGTATGFDALIKGEIDICTASRPLRSLEARQLVERQQNLGVATLVAKDGLSIYLHPDNPVRNLSMAQVRDIYLGKIKYWREVGGSEEAIVVLSRSPNSGTYLYFQEHVLEGQAYSSHTINMPTTAAIVAEIERNPRALGYGGIAYGQQLVHCRIEGISPTTEAVRKDVYPIARYLYVYTIKKPEGLTKRFIDWVLSREGQRLVQEAGYIPLFEVP